jgi:hypothetical protein
VNEFIFQTDYDDTYLCKQNRAQALVFSISPFRSASKTADFCLASFFLLLKHEPYTSATALCISLSTHRWQLRVSRRQGPTLHVTFVVKRKGGGGGGGRRSGGREEADLVD